MKRIIPSLLILCLTVIVISPSVRAQVATKNQALTVAANWIHTIIEKKGDWGGYKSAEIAEIQEFKRRDRVLGFFAVCTPGVTSLYLYAEKWLQLRHTQQSATLTPSRTKIWLI
jgi:hypothetical protein